MSVIVTICNTLLCQDGAETLTRPSVLLPFSLSNLKSSLLKRTACGMRGRLIVDRKVLANCLTTYL